MRENQAIPNQNGSAALPKAYFSRKLLMIVFGAGLFVYGLMLAGLLLAPEYAVLGLAGIGIGIPVLVFIWHRPEFGLLALIFLTSSFVPADIVDIRLPIGGGLDLRDLVLLGLFGLLFVRELVRKTICVPWWTVGGPLVLFLSLAVVSVFYAIVFMNVEMNWALSDARILGSYVIFFITIWSIKRIDQLQILLIGIFIIADLTTLIVVLQQFIGADHPLLQSMLTTRDWRVFQEAGGVRVIPAGHLLMHFMWFIALGFLMHPGISARKKALFVFQFLFIGIGHVLTYMRAQWAAMLIGSGLICLVILPRYRFLLPKYLILGTSMIFIVMLLWGTFGLSNVFQIPLVTGVVDRFLSLLEPDNTMESNSLQWREFENAKALEAIKKQPLLGVGLGGRYRELTTFQGEALGSYTRGSLAAGEVSRFTRYVHNSYLSIAVKMGIPGLLAIVWFCVAFLVNGWKIYQNMFYTEYRGIVLGVIASFVGLMVWCFFHAHFIKAESTPVIGLMTGLVAVVDALHKIVLNPPMPGVSLENE